MEEERLAQYIATAKECANDAIQQGGNRPTLIEDADIGTDFLNAVTCLNACAWHYIEKAKKGDTSYGESFGSFVDTTVNTIDALKGMEWSRYNLIHPSNGVFLRLRNGAARLTGRGLLLVPDDMQRVGALPCIQRLYDNIIGHSIVVAKELHRELAESATALNDQALLTVCASIGKQLADATDLSTVQLSLRRPEAPADKTTVPQRRLH